MDDIKMAKKRRIRIMREKIAEKEIRYIEKDIDSFVKSYMKVRKFKENLSGCKEAIKTLMKKYLMEDKEKCELEGKLYFSTEKGKHDTKQINTLLQWQKKAMEVIGDEFKIIRSKNHDLIRAHINLSEKDLLIEAKIRKELDI